MTKPKRRPAVRPQREVRDVVRAARMNPTEDRRLAEVAEVLDIPESEVIRQGIRELHARVLRPADPRGGSYETR